MRPDQWPWYWRAAIAIAAAGVGLGIYAAKQYIGLAPSADAPGNLGTAAPAGVAGTAALFVYLRLRLPPRTQGARLATLLRDFGLLLLCALAIATVIVVTTGPVF